jgi:hypothetical protein
LAIAAMRAQHARVGGVMVLGGSVRFD